KEFLATNPFSNTTIAVVATNAALSKDDANKIAQMAHDGIAQTIRPAHTMFDGDTIFALTSVPYSASRSNTATTALQVSTLGAAAAITLAQAIVKAVYTAHDLHGVPAIAHQAS
ncbi:MAG: P1 family peptidase, partial [Ktedonobacteraceae bacterium]|nr:P1 family peptidase [Ktedonobacteraceae bacterium]